MIIRKGSLLLLLLCLLSMALSGLADGYTYSGGVYGYRLPEKVYVLNKNAGLWPEPSATGKALVNRVGIEYVVTVYGQSDGWTEVELLDGTHGYMQTRYLGGLYLIHARDRVYALREKGADRAEFNSVSFDRRGEDLLVLWEEENWVYVIELRDGLGGYIPRDRGYDIVQYP